MGRHLVPAAPIAALIVKHKVAETATSGKEWCTLNGFAWDTIKSVLRGKRKFVEFNTADRILSALGCEEEWWNGLSDHYLQVSDDESLAAYFQEMNLYMTGALDEPPDLPFRGTAWL